MNMASAAVVPDFHMKKYAGYYKPKILRPEVHMTLVETIEEVADVARVPEKFIYKVKMSDYCSAAEMDWVAQYHTLREDGLAGFAYVGTPQRLEDRMFAMAGAFLRNYIDARIFTIHEIVDRLKASNMGDYSVVMVPNFYTGGKKKFPDWQVALVQSWLSGRYARSKVLVLGVRNMEELAVGYGTQVASHIQDRFKLVTF